MLVNRLELGSSEDVDSGVLIKALGVSYRIFCWGGGGGDFLNTYNIMYRISTGFFIGGENNLRM